MSLFSEKHRNLLLQGANKLHLELSTIQVEKLDAYAQLLKEWGGKINLTAVLDTEAIIIQHFLDSLALVSQLPKSSPSYSLVDVGSGAGFPGVICALLNPTWRITLVEKVYKKTVFLSELKRKLECNYQILAASIEQIDEKFDVVVSRAAFPPELWAVLGSSLVNSEGRLFFMMGMKEYKLSISKDFVEEKEFIYDVGAGSHRIHVWRKIPDKIIL